MIKKHTIPTILGLILLVVSTASGIFFLKNTQGVKIGAATDAMPKNVRVGNITDTSVVVSWTTDAPTTALLVWGPSSTNLNRTQQEDASNQKYHNHSIILTGLLPSTNFYYKINSDGTNFDNNGVPWQFVTGQALDATRDSVLISGSVINAAGNPEKRALVYADIEGYMLVTQTSDTGNYVIQIGSARTPDLSRFVTLDLTRTLIQISVQAGPTGIASAQIYPQSANPVPPIIIGQTYDFRSNPVNSLGAIPGADLNVPQDSIQTSRFNVSVESGSVRPTSVILESLTEGETITSQKPQFFGKGPAGTNINIVINSTEQVQASVQVPGNGSWSFAVPNNLSPGSHSITISWVDVSGITRFLTRNFVVKAGEIPAFTASGSGQIATPTVSATATPSPTSSPTIRPSASPSATAVATLAPSPSATTLPIPVTGDLTPTLLLSIMGVSILAFSFVVWKIAES